jgi:threonine dehydrogenase-like Zn-dependent dehydrogenase
MLVLLSTVCAGCGGPTTDEMPLKEVRRTRAGTLDVVLLASGESLAQGQSTAALEFRRANGTLVDVGTVKVNATMPMAGMAPMIASGTVQPTARSGRYHVSAEFGMAGTWRFDISWDGPAGQGSASLPGTVR